MQAVSFIYKNITSEDFDLYIGGINQNGITDMKSNISTEILYDYVTNRNENTIFGVKQKDRLFSFDLSLYSEQEITSQDALYIEDYLFNNPKLDKLVICQEDMMGYYFIGTFTKGEKIKVGGVTIGYNVTFTCDSPFVYSSERKDTTECNSISETEIIINNTSSGLCYLFPTIKWINTSPNGWIKIINSSDNNRTFEMRELATNELITIDKWQQMTSSLGLNRLDNCNYNFIRLTKGVNKIKVIGTSQQITFLYNLMWSI